MMHVKWCAPLINNACNYEDDACEMMCSHYQCMQSCGWCMWIDVPSLIISACNHEVERLKKFLSNLNNLLFCCPWVILSQFLLAQHEISSYYGFFLSFDFLWFFFQPSTITSLGTGSHTCPSYFFMSKGVSTLTCFPFC